MIYCPHSKNTGMDVRKSFGHVIYDLDFVDLVNGFANDVDLFGIIVEKTRKRLFEKHDQ